MSSQKNKSLKHVSRRAFLRGSAAAFGIAAFPFIVPSSVLGASAPSNRIAMGFIGTGGMGMNNIKGFKAKREAEVVAVCDVDSAHRQQAMQQAGITEASAYNDFRQVLARDDIDAVVVSTPDHWHIPISIAAVKAGKDVYCEKPLTLTIAEGRLLADAVKRYGRVFQTGSQQRSNTRFRFGCELVRNGRIGKVHTVHVGIPGNNRFCGPTWVPETVPKELDYNLWLGSAPWQPYLKQRCHYTFRFILDYSGGQVTNWGAHHLDIAQWGLGMDSSGPVEVIGRGEFPHTGLFTTATKVYFECIYENDTRLICQTNDKTGITFRGTEGWIYVNRGVIEAEPKSLLESVIGPDEQHLYRSNDHKQNFLDCIKTRRQPIASAEIGHRSASVCHLGNIAMLTGRKLKWNPQTECFTGDFQANQMLSRPILNGWRM
jgi:predicted dehydrogenase